VQQAPLRSPVEQTFEQPLAEQQQAQSHSPSLESGEEQNSPNDTPAAEESLHSTSAADESLRDRPAGLENVFNSQLMPEAVAARCPGLLPLASWAYKQHTRLLVSGAEVTVPSQRRASGRPPRSPPLRPHAPVPAGGGDPHPIAYADDKFCRAAPRNARAPSRRSHTARRPAQPDACTRQLQSLLPRRIGSWCSGRGASNAARARQPRRRGHVCGNTGLRVWASAHLRRPSLWPDGHA
jgi:hypothetical protein